MGAFEEGYTFFEKQAGAQLAGFEGETYVEQVKAEINRLLQDLNTFEGFQTMADKLKGDIAEFWHADTFNINAVARDSSHRTFVDRSHDFASQDISSNFEKIFGLKYYKDGVASAKAQAKNIFERFREYQYGGGKDTLEEFLSKRGYDDEAVLSDPIYLGQIRVIPKEQLEMACQWLKEKIAKEAVIRPEQMDRYKDTLQMLSNKVEDGIGTTSVELSDADAKLLATLAKEGDVTTEELQKLGISAEAIIKYEYIIQQACKAGVTAATISMVLKVAPEIYKAIQYLIENGELDEQQFQKIGFAAVRGGTEGFIRGSLAAAITIACKKGQLGNFSKNVSPVVIGMTTVLALNTMRDAFDVACGKMSSSELARRLTRDIIISSTALAGGAAGQALIQIPVLGYMIGSFIGSTVGAFAYTCGTNIMLSFCVDTGFTMFGFVKQDFTLPEDVLMDIGMDVFEYEKFQYDVFQHDEFIIQPFEFDSFEPESINIRPLRRGVIGVAKVGYI